MTRKFRILIHPAHPADAPRIITLFTAVADERDSIGTEPGFDVAQRQSSILASIEEGTNCMLVAASEDVVVGSLGLHVRHNVGSLGMMVAREHRRQGIGGRLLDESLRWARERGLHKVDLEVWPHNAAAIALYRSRGFAVEGRLRRHYRRANGQLWDSVPMGLVLDTQSPGSSHPDADNLCDGPGKRPGGHHAVACRELDATDVASAEDVDGVSFTARPRG